jgi:chemosensory pili system protein ChpA (sensor histidine kinase/response regulator)
MTASCTRSPALSADLMRGFYAEAGEVLGELHRGFAALGAAPAAAFTAVLAPLSLLAHRLRGHDALDDQDAAPAVVVAAQ